MYLCVLYVVLYHYRASTEGGTTDLGEGGHERGRGQGRGLGLAYHRAHTSRLREQPVQSLRLYAHSPVARIRSNP